MILVRRLLGQVLRDERASQGRTLRDVSEHAGVSLGYLSELERGVKEASSECLAAVCRALRVPLSAVLAQVSDEVARVEVELDLASIGTAASDSVVALRPVTPAGAVKDLAA